MPAADRRVVGFKTQNSLQSPPPSRCRALTSSLRRIAKARGWEGFWHAPRRRTRATPGRPSRPSPHTENTNTRQNNRPPTGGLTMRPPVPFTTKGAAKGVRGSATMAAPTMPRTMRGVAKLADAAILEIRLFLKQEVRGFVVLRSPRPCSA